MSKQEFDDLIEDLDFAKQELDLYNDSGFVEFEDEEDEGQYIAALSAIKECKEILDSIAEESTFETEQSEDWAKIEE